MHHRRWYGRRSTRAATLASGLVLTLSTLALSAAPVAALTSTSDPAAVAQAPVAADTLVEVRLGDGSSFVGRVVAETADRLTLETVGGTRIELDRARIRSITPVRGRVVDGVYWREDPNRTRLLLLAPTGRSLRGGAGYVSTFWVGFPFVAYGINDHFTIAGGTPLFPGVVGRVIYLAPKLQVVSTPTMDAAVGVLALFATQELDSGSAGIGYGVATFGNTDRSVSTGAGWAFAVGDGDGWISDEPLFMLGGEYRVSRSVKLLTENYFLLSESGSLVTGGVRLFGERLSADFGLGAVLARGTGDLPWFPLLNFVYNFGP